MSRSDIKAVPRGTFHLADMRPEHVCTRGLLVVLICANKTSLGQRLNLSVVVLVGVGSVHSALSISYHRDGLRGGGGRRLPLPLPAHKENNEQNANDDDDDDGDDDGDEWHFSGGVDVGADVDVTIPHSQIQLHAGDVGAPPPLPHPFHVLLITLHTSGHCTVLVGQLAIWVDHCMVQCVHATPANATPCIAS